MNKPRIAFAGDRQIAVNLLDFLLAQGFRPEMLMVPDPKLASHSQQLRKKCEHLDRNSILVGDQFRQKKGIEQLERLGLDYIVSIHFPYIYPKEVLRIPKKGALNLHPAYLPYNKGWHTPTWAIMEKTPIGATLHYMDEGLDTGKIVWQKELRIKPEDTANRLYQKLLQLEEEVFVEAWPKLVKGQIKPKKQIGKGSFHKKKDLESVREIKLETRVKTGDLINKLKGLTTNQMAEAAYFRKGNKKYFIWVQIEEA